ncbi:MAG: hypothetical protein HOE90_22695 [Bacteriovoracaceae bacterium]|nr:hypothetical protein [Bacteriovoracaceae bacterium]
MKTFICLMATFLIQSAYSGGSDSLTCSGKLQKHLSHFTNSSTGYSHLANDQKNLGVDSLDLFVRSMGPTELPDQRIFVQLTMKDNKRINLGRTFSQNLIKTHTFNGFNYRKVSTIPGSTKTDSSFLMIYNVKTNEGFLELYLSSGSVRMYSYKLKCTHRDHRRPIDNI